MLTFTQKDAVPMKAEAKLILLGLQQTSVNTLRVSLKMTENVLENFPQLLLVLIITLTMMSDTVTELELSGIDEILKGGSSTAFLLITAMISFTSLVKGHIDLVMTKRNGMVGIVGKMILLPYLLINIASR